MQSQNNMHMKPAIIVSNNTNTLITNVLVNKVAAGFLSRSV